MKLSKSAQTKQFIIERVSPVFNTKGYVGTSMQDIMDATGLTKGGVYGNYKSKEQIAYAAFDFNVEKVMIELGKRVSDERNAPDKLQAVLKYYKTYFYTPPIAGGCPMLNMAIEADDTHPGLRVKVMGALDTLRSALVHILRRGQEFKQIKEDTDIQRFATIFISTIEGGIMMSRTYQDFGYLKDCLAHLSALVEGIKA